MASLIYDSCRYDWMLVVDGLVVGCIVVRCGRYGRVVHDGEHWVEPPLHVTDG